jgi:hypothetical protein
MIAIADSQQALQTQRRKTGNGWHTTFIGENRMTRDPGTPEPDGATLFPMAFLVEKDPGAVVHPHFHRADQYQVVVAGSAGSAGTRWTASRFTTPTPIPPTVRSSPPRTASPGSPCATPGTPVRAT